MPAWAGLAAALRGGRGPLGVLLWMSGRVALPVVLAAMAVVRGGRAGLGSAGPARRQRLRHAVGGRLVQSLGGLALMLLFVEYFAIDECIAPWNRRSGSGADDLPPVEANRDSEGSGRSFHVSEERSELKTRCGGFVACE